MVAFTTARHQPRDGSLFWRPDMNEHKIDPYCAGGTSPPQPVSDIVPGATPTRRRGKSMSRRVGQNGNVFVKSNCKLRRCDHPKGLCPKYGRYWKDQPGQHERLRVVVSLGSVTQTIAERNLREHIRKTRKSTPRKHSWESHRQPSRSRSKRSGGSTKCVPVELLAERSVSQSSQQHWQAIKQP